jgi:hypothetical protein
MGRLLFADRAARGFGNRFGSNEIYAKSKFSQLPVFAFPAFLLRCHGSKRWRLVRLSPKGLVSERSGTDLIAAIRSAAH